MLFFLCFFSSFYSHAITTTWDGASNSSWKDGTNWDNGAPQPGDDVIIGPGTNNCILDVDINGLNSLTIENGGHLTVDQNLELTINNGNKQRAIEVKQNGTLINLGGIGIFNHTGDGFFLGNGVLTNDGDIIINDIDSGNGGTGKGFYNEGTVNNHGDIDIEDTDAIGWENIHTLHNNGTIDIKNLNGSAVGMYNEGTINNNGGDRIHIDNVPGTYGLENTGNLTNSGLIIIEDLTNSTGLFNSDVLTNNNDILIRDLSDGFAIHNTKIFNNSDLIDIDRVANYAIYNTSAGTFSNTLSSNIDINDVTVSTLDGGGILNENSFTFTGTSTLSIQNILGTNLGQTIGIKNSGTMSNTSDCSISIFDMDHSSLTDTLIAIENTNSFIVNGDLTMDSIDGRYVIGIDNQSIMTINDQCILQNVRGFISSYGLRNSGTLNKGSNGNFELLDIVNTNGAFGFDENYALVNLLGGDINVESVWHVLRSRYYGIQNFGSITYMDTLRVEGYQTTGIISDGNITGGSNGFLNVSDNCNSGCGNVSGIINNGMMNNAGDIIVEDLKFGYEGERLINTGVIKFTGAPMTFKDVLDNSGEVHVYNTNLPFTNRDSVINRVGGLIVVDSTSFGVGLSNSTDTSVLINQGKIEINRCHDVQLVNFGKVVNSDSIIMEKINSGDGINNAINSTFVNEATGVIILHNGIATNGRTLENQNDFTNHGIIDIYKTNALAIINTGDITNTGMIKADSLNTTSSTNQLGLNNIGGTVVNSGTIDFNTGILINGGHLTNSGSIIINGHWGVALQCNDTLINTNTGIINIGDQVQFNVQNKGAIDLASANDYLQNDNVINIGAVEGEAINNAGTVINNKTIRITQAETGILNEHHLENNIGAIIWADTLKRDGISHSWLLDLKPGSDTLFNKGVLRLDSSEWGGINSNAPIVNTGDIDIQHITNYGISASYLFNSSTAEINITNSNTTFNFCAGISTFINEGDFIISNSQNSTGLSTNNGLNSGNMEFTNVVGAISCQNFHNEANGVINIGNSDLGNDQFSSGINITSEFINDNLIVIDSVNGIAISNDGKLINNKNININDSQTAFYNQDSLINSVNGFIDINRVEQFGIRNQFDGVGTEKEKYIANHGIIRISDISDGDGIDNRGSISNHGTIDIDECRGNNRNAIENSGNIVNETNGIIDIRGTYTGIYNFENVINHGMIDVDKAITYGIFNTDSLTNHSIMNVDSAGMSGIYSYAQSTALVIFINESNAVINVNNADVGLDVEGNNFQSKVSRTTNNGKITITNSRDRGVQVEVLGILDNMDTLLIDQAVTGIYNNNQFNNKTGGYVEVKDVLGNSGTFNHGIYNIKDITNENCATISLLSSLHNRRNFLNPAHFYNHGLLHQNTQFDNNILDTMDNHGIFIDEKSSTSDIGTIRNHGMYFTPIGGSPKCNTTLSNFFVGSGTDITGTLITEDKAGNTSAGTMNVPTNQIMLNATVENVDTLYGHFTINGSCQITIPIFFENTITCGACGAITTWTGAAANNDWHTAANWSSGTVPDVCNEVIIPNGANCIISNGNTGECFLIQIDAGANFEVNGGLDVIGN